MTVAEAKNVEEMPILIPAGWRWARLGEVCKQDKQIITNGEKIGNLPYVGLENIESNTGSIYIDSLIADNEVKSTTFAFDERHVLYGKLRPYLNKVALPNFQGRCTTELIPLLVEPGISREFIAWILKRGDTVEAAMKEKTGSRMPRANMDDLLTISIPLPPTLTEQKRIAGILNEQMVSVAKARDAAGVRLEAAKALPAAYLRQTFPKPGQELPPGWQWVILGELCEFKRGPFGGSLKKEIFVVHGYKVYEQKHAIQDDFTIGSYFIDANKFREMSAFSLHPGNLIISCSGTMGKVAIVPVDAQPGIINQALLKLAPVLDTIDPYYLKSYLISDPIQIRYFRQTAGAAIQNIASVSVLKNMPIPIPPLTEQKRIIAMINEQMSAVEKTVQTLQQELKTINALSAALLRRAFTGGL